MMSGFLIDVNLPRFLSIWNSDKYHFVIDLDPQWTDSQIWRYAIDHNLTIVSRDADFSVRVLVAVEGPHVIHVRLGNAKIARIHAILTPLWGEIVTLSAKCRIVSIYPDRIEAIE